MPSLVPMIQTVAGNNARTAPGLLFLVGFPSAGRISSPWSIPGRTVNSGSAHSGRPGYGLPFDQDRLLLIWIASTATSQKTRAIRVRSAATILETFSRPKDGRYYRRRSPDSSGSSARRSSLSATNRMLAAPPTIP